MSQYSRLKKKETIEATNKNGKTKVVKVKEHFSNGVTALQKTIAIIGGSLGICTALITLNNYRNGNLNTSSTGSEQTASVFNWNWGNTSTSSSTEFSDDGSVIESSATQETNTIEADSVSETTNQDTTVENTPMTETVQEPTVIETPSVEGITE